MDIRIGIIGDYDPDRLSHTATEEALAHAARSLSLRLAITWLPTPTLDQPEGVAALRSFDALWCAPGSPYRSTDGALAAIRFAREEDWPLIGT